MSTGMELIPRAKELYRQGFFPLPVYYKSKAATFKWRPYKNERPPWSVVEGLFNTRLLRNLAIMTGIGGLVVLDFDILPEYFKWRNHHTELAQETYTVRSGKGFHVYLKLKNPPAYTLSMGCGEIKASGYVVAPPSIHPSGRSYEHYCGFGIVELEDLKAAGIKPVLPEFTRKVGQPTVDKINVNNKGSLITAIKRNLPLVSLLSQYSEIHYNSDRWAMCCCPLHDDHNPSMWIDLERGFCNCFNPSCRGHGLPMDVINLYAKIAGMSNQEAIIELGNKLGII